MGIVFFIYNLLFSLLLIVFLPYLYLKRQNRKDGFVWLKERFGLISGEKIKSIHGRPIWIHAVSVGEVMAALPLIRAIKERYPGKSLVLSTVTDTGNLIARERAKDADTIIYLPFDISLFVNNVLQRVRPEVFILIETEIWPNLLRSLYKAGIPSLVINGRISQESFRGYSLGRLFMRYILKYISKFGMQTHSDAERMIAIGAEPSKIEIIGNIKFDYTPLQPSMDIKKVRDLYCTGDRHLFVAGSTHEGEEEIILDIFKELKKDFKDILLLIAPRHIDRVKRIEGLMRERDIIYRRRTELSENVPDEVSVIVLDTIGELAHIYSIASVVFIGGSLVPSGGHNILEPAVYSKAILFGPYMDNFEDITRIFLEKGAARQVTDGSHLRRELEYLLMNGDESRLMGEKAMNVVDENKGAVKRSLVMIEEFLT